MQKYLRIVQPAVRGVLLLAAILFAVFPIYWMLLTTVTSRFNVMSRHPKIFPSLRDISIASYGRVWSEKAVAQWLLNSGVVTIFSVLVSTLAALMAAYAVSRAKSGLVAGVGYAMLLTRILPGTVLVLPLFALFNLLGVRDSLLSLVIANVSVMLPFSTWMLKSFIDNIPFSLEEAAMLDGCTKVGSIIKAVVPLTGPGLAAVVLYGCVLTWGEYLFSSTFIDTRELWTLNVGLATFMNERGTDWSGLMATATISLIPMIVVFSLLQRFFVSGSTTGSVKG